MCAHKPRFCSIGEWTVSVLLQTIKGTRVFNQRKIILPFQCQESQMGKTGLQSWPKIMGQFATYISKSFSAPPPLAMLLRCCVYVQSEGSQQLSTLRGGGGVSENDDDSLNKAMATAYTCRCVTSLTTPHRGFSGPMNTIMTEQNIQQQLLRIPTGRRQASWLLISAAEKLNQGLPGTNSTSGQNVS